MKHTIEISAVCVSDVLISFYDFSQQFDAYAYASVLTYARAGKLYQQLKKKLESKKTSVKLQLTPVDAYTIVYIIRNSEANTGGKLLELEIGRYFPIEKMKF